MADSTLSPASPPVRPEPAWHVRPPAGAQAVLQLSRELGVPPLLAAVLLARGVGKEGFESLTPALAPTAIPDLERAAERLERALKARERILIHGDYDADGISGTAVLTLGLRALGGHVTPFIPNRLTDGYGISAERVPEHCERADLLLTVDCGIGNLAEIEALQAGGVEVIVSDHHLPGEREPNCLIVHPKKSPLAHPGRPELTGAGIAYHLLWALHTRLGLEPPLEYSDLASIGTIADVAPLMGENRALIQQGLARLGDSKWPGIRAMVSQNGLREGVRARDVAFIIAPRLNAAGRLGEADLGLELLTTSSERRARELAAYLDARNFERRNIQDRMLTQALELVDPEAPALVLEHPDWHAGVMGIVASKLVDRFFKPVFIIAQGKGSVRSIPGISAVECLRHAGDHLLRFGGHEQAAGFGVQGEKVPLFRESLFDYLRTFPAPQPRVVADALVSAADIDQDLFDAIQELEPYGQGHASPVFALTDTLDLARAVGKGGSHLQLRVGGVKGVCWSRGHDAGRLKRGGTVNAAVSLQENEWQGRKNLEFIAEELREGRPLGFEASGSGDPGATPPFGRGAPPLASEVTRVHGELPETPAAAHGYWLTSLPLETAEPLAICGPLEVLVRSGATLHFDLGEGEQERLLRLALLYPGVAELRQAFVWLQRGQPLPFEPAKAELCQAALRELDLLDPRGFPRRAQKRDPYGSDTLTRGLVERYRLRGLVNAYRHLDDTSFALTVSTLFA